MTISLQEKRESYQAAYPGEYGMFYDAAYVAAYNASFEPLLAALLEGFRNGEIDSIDAENEKTLTVKQTTLEKVEFPSLSCFVDHREIAKDHGREEGCEDAFSDAVSSAKEQTRR